MPLRDEAPVIDNRTWQNIVDEIRSRIPHYTQEWTDFNDNDPGITLAQVFAHLAEMLLFRMARVPDLAYVKFLELIGIELIPARPARAEVTLAVAEGYLQATALVPARTQVSAPGDDGPPVVFETERPLTALACRLSAVQVDDAAQYREVTRLNADAQAGYEPFGPAPRVNAALVLGFAFADAHPNVDAFPAVAIDLAMWTQQDPRVPLVQQCGPGSTRAYASARLTWEGWNGALWVKLDALSDETLAFTRDGHVVVRVPASAGLRRAYLGDYEALNRDTGEAQPRLFWIRARIVDTQYEIAPRLLAVRINTVPVLQAQTVRDEILGGTTGDRNQLFAFANRPVLDMPGSVEITIDQGQGDETWEVKPDLLGSSARDRHVVINYAAGELYVGDGINGAVPVANASNPDANVIAREYRFGGGSRGNVAAHTIQTLLTPVDGIDGAATDNLFAAFGGAEEEKLEAARKRAPESLRARERAVTPEDFQLLARNAANVRRAKALPLAHPQFPGVKVPGTITVIVVPDRRKPDEVPPIGAMPPLPSAGTLRTVCEYLDARRLLTTELFVVAPSYVTVRIGAQVVAGDDADTARVREDVELALRRYLDPLIGGDDGEGWPFGGALRYSKIVQRVFTVDGVDSVPSLRIVVNGELAPNCADVALDPIASNALPHLVAHDIEVVTVREAEATA